MALSDADARCAQDAHDRLGGARDALRALVSEADDAQLKASLETAAEAVGGLMDAFVDIQEGDEAAWGGG